MADDAVLDLRALPAPDAIEVVDYETIFASMLADLCQRDPAFTALVESDPAYKVLEVAAYREMLLRLRVNQAVRTRLLAYATGSDLDHLGAFYGVVRLVVQAADPDAQPIPLELIMEGDERFRLRIRDRIMGSSAAGGAAHYRFHAMTVSAAIRDVAVDSPSNGVVRVSVLAWAGSGVPSPELLAAVTEKMTSDSVRVLTHEVQVVPAVMIPVDVTAEVKLLPATPMEVFNRLDATLRASAEAVRGLGWDCSYSWLMSALHVAGVRSVVLSAPVHSVVVEPNQCIYLRNVALTYAGRGY